MFALHYAFDLFGLVSEPQKKPTTGPLNATLEPLTSVATGVVGAEGHAGATPQCAATPS